MSEKIPAPDGETILLSLAPGRRLLMPNGEAVLGWIGTESARAAEPLAFPSPLLEPKAAGSVSYAANLPRAGGRGKAGASAGAFAKSAQKIPASKETVFRAASLPGGQVPTLTPAKAPGLLRLRWLPLTAASWRCYIRLCAEGFDGAWLPLPHIYEFDASGFLENEPAPHTIDVGRSKVTVSHPEGLLTSLPCKAGRVKITKLETDGWGKRELVKLQLHPDRSIEAEFSDRKKAVFAIAAPLRAAPALAA
jgi:hypothetical protein